MITSCLGSDPCGRALQRWTCARSHDSKGAVSPCTEDGGSFCSKCHQVKYCSRECQLVHWKRHKSTCSSPYASKTWVPTCEVEDRFPDYMIKDDWETMPRFPIMMQGVPNRNYLWGNIAAFDLLNVPMNEGKNIKSRDLNLCFAASGDLRNVIKTLNALPEDYNGRCTLVINDLNLHVAIRNVVLLSMMLDTAIPSVELLAEVVLHAWYSASLTTAQFDFVEKWMGRIEQHIEGNSPLFHGELKLKPGSSMEWWYPGAVADLHRDIKAATYSKSSSEADRRRMMLSNKRLDHRERYFTDLRPRHRVGYSRWLETGVVLPLGQPVDTFNKPNKLLFTPDGQWLLVDHDSPHLGWDALSVEETRKKMGLPDEDYFGSLFFHIKQECISFILRARRFKLSVVLYSVDINYLPVFLDIRSFGTQKRFFDRIEVSNVMDTVPPAAIISAWGPRLNRKNPNSALLMYSMNLARKRKDANLEGQPLKTSKKIFEDCLSFLGRTKGSKPPSIHSIMTSTEAFMDTRPPFMAYLREEGVPEACKTAKVRQRHVSRLLPARIGVRLRDYNSPKITITPEEYYFTGNLMFPTWLERFVEFEPIP